MGNKGNLPVTLPGAGASDQETATTAKAFSIGNRLPRTADYQSDNLGLESPFFYN